MKKKAIIISILLIVITLMIAVIVQNNTFAATLTVTDENGITWTFTSSGTMANNVYVSGGSLQSTLTIPSTLTVNGTTYTVRTLKNSTSGRNICGNMNVSGVTSVVIPDTVTSIGSYAFSNFSNLRSVTFGNSVTMIDSYAFYKCANLNNITIPDSVVTIYGYAFKECTSLKSLDLGNGVQQIYAYAFDRCPIEGTLKIPDSLITLNKDAFTPQYGYETTDYNTGIKKVVIGKKLNNINAFEQLKGLQDYEVTEGNTAYSAQDGILFNADKTTLIKCAVNKTINNYMVPNTVKRIENNAFQNSKVSGEIVFPDSLTYIGNYAFYSSKLSGKLNIPDSVTYIGSYAFEYCNDITELKLSNNIDTLGYSCFAYNKGLTGDITINGTLTQINGYMFKDCTNLNGILRVGDSVKQISDNAFSGTNFKRVYLGSGINNISYGAFDGYEDIWIDNLKENVTLREISRTTSPYIHWANDTHKLTVSTLPGIKIINVDTNEEITSGVYDCETAFEYKVIIDPEKNYNDIKIVEVNDENVEEFMQYDYEENKIYKFDPLIRNRSIYVQRISNGTDLALRTFITEVNREVVPQSRIAEARIVDGTVKYIHTKYPVVVTTGDTVTLKLRVYNEGIEAGKANKIAVILPEGIELVEGNTTNLKYNWQKEGNKYTSTYISNKEISAYIGNGKINYEELQMVVKVTEEKAEEQDILKTIYAEILSAHQTDVDSAFGNVDYSNTTDYKKEEIYASSFSSYIKGQEDDDDFETVLLRGKIKVDYNIKINKIDGQSLKLLKGAKFELVNEEDEDTVVATATTGEDGVLDFGQLTTYGEGNDVWYIKEVGTPEGYKITEGKRIKVRVEKKIIDETLGTYSINVYCDTVDYTVDTSDYEFTPIKTADQLRKIGSGENFNIDGKDYVFTTTSNYKLMNDIDFDGLAPWVPISQEMSCVFDGNGHKIKNIKIEATDDISVSEIGLFSVFSGIIENTEMENVTININKFSSTAQNTSGKTGIGAFAGVMKEGYIINCKVSGLISANEDNIGGFVGHTLEDGIVRVQNCINNANVIGKGATVAGQNSWGGEEIEFTGASNIGGIIGCALGSISIEDTENNGTIRGENYNVGGIVGFSKSSDYQDPEITGGFNDSDRTIDLLVANELGEFEGEYTFNLEIRDRETSNLLKNGTYTVYDSYKNPISGLDHIKVTDGKIKIATKNTTSVGIDSFYIVENEPDAGYRDMIGVLEFDVQKSWNPEEEEYNVQTSLYKISKEEFENKTVPEGLSEVEAETGDSSNTGLDLEKDPIFTETRIAKANWNTRKEEFINCTNNGSVSTAFMNSAGIIGTSYGVVTIKDCTNTAQIVSAQKSGGIIAELRTLNFTDNTYDERVNIKTQNTSEYSNITGCTNTADIVATGVSGNTYQYIGGSSSGILSYIVGNVKINDSINKGQITGVNGRCAAGILAEMEGKIEITGSRNEGTIQSPSQNSDVNALAAGIIAKNRYNELAREASSIVIKDSANYGNIFSACHLGGAVAYTTALDFEVNNFTMDNSKIEQDPNSDEQTKLNVIQYHTGDNGGVVGICSAKNIKISNIKIDNVNFNKSTQETGTYGATSGIIGNVYSDWQYKTDNVRISNCTVSNSYVMSGGKEAAGVIACQTNNNNMKTEITDCIISNNIIFNNMYDSDTYGIAAGIYGGTYAAGNLKISNCKVENGTVQKVNGWTGTSSAAGLVGSFHMCRDLEITSCQVKDMRILNYNKGTGSGSLGGTAAGIGYNGFCDEGNVYGNTIMKDCDFERCYMEGLNGNVGGAIGTSMYTNVELDGVNVVECDMKKLEGNSGTTCNAGGLIAFLQNNPKLYISNCKVIGKNTQVKNEKNYVTLNNGNLGGICGFIGYGSQDTKMENVEVRNMNIYTNYGQDLINCVAGGIGGNGSLQKIKNITIDNCDIFGQASNNVSGFVGYDGSNNPVHENITVSNCNITNNRRSDQSYCTATSGLMSAYCGGGIYKLNNAKVLNTNIDGKTGLLTGGIGYVGTLIADNVLIDGVNITDTWEYVQKDGHEWRSQAGFVAVASSNASMSNIHVNNTTINGGYGAIGGVYAYTNTLEKLENCGVNKLTINKKYTKSYKNGAVGAIGGNTYIAKTPIKNIKVEKSDISTVGLQIGGAFGYIEEAVTFDNVIVDNTKVTNHNNLITPFKEYPQLDDILYNTDVGGILAMCNGDVTIKNSTVSNSDILGENNGGQYLHVGGIQGYGNGDVTIENSKVKNCSVKNLTTGSATVGGFLGIAGKGYDSSNNYVAHSLTIKDSSIEQGSNIEGTANVAGIMANGVAKIDGLTINDLTVKDGASNTGGVIAVTEPGSDMNRITINGLTISTTNGNVGGISPVLKGDVTNINMSNVNLTGPYDVGGVAMVFEQGSLNGAVLNNVNVTGGNRGAGVTVVNKVDLRNITVSNSEINGVNESAGIASYAENGTVDTATLNNVKVTTTGSYAKAGIGFAIINNNSTSNVTVNGGSVTGCNDIGGVVAVVPGGNLTNVSVNGATIKTTGGHAGAIAAYVRGDINEANVTDSSVTAIAEAGGIVGVIDGNIDKATVTGTTVKTEMGDAGGLVGATRYRISNSTVKNTTVTSDKFAGGVVGAGLYDVSLGKNTPELVNVIVENNTITAPTKGEYIGAPQEYDEILVQENETPEESDSDSDPNQDSNQDSSNDPDSSANPDSNLESTLNSSLSSMQSTGFEPELGQLPENNIEDKNKEDNTVDNTEDNITDESNNLDENSTENNEITEDNTSNSAEENDIDNEGFGTEENNNQEETKNEESKNEEPSNEPENDLTDVNN